MLSICKISEVLCNQYDINQVCFLLYFNDLFVGVCMESLKVNSDVLFILLGAIMVLAMHAGFAFLEVGTVRSKNQVNALVKIICDFAVSTIAYFFIGYFVAYQTGFFHSAEILNDQSG